MGCDRDVNAYYWPEYQKVESGAWKFQNYDTNGDLYILSIVDLMPAFSVMPRAAINSLISFSAESSPVLFSASNAAFLNYSRELP